MQYTLFCRISSSPPTFVVVTEVSFSFNPKVDAVSFLIKLTWAPVSKRVFACFWTVNICGNYRQKCAVGYRCICHCDPERFALMEDGVMILIALSPVLRYGTLLPLSTVCCSVISSGSPHTAKTYVIFFRHFQSFINAESSKFRALVWPMGGVLA